MSIPEEQFSGPGFILRNLISWTRDGNAWEGRDQAICGINSRIYGSERIGPFGINKRRLGGGGDFGYGGPRSPAGGDTDGVLDGGGEDLGAAGAGVQVAAAGGQLDPQARRTGVAVVLGRGGR